MYANRRFSGAVLLAPFLCLLLSSSTLGQSSSPWVDDLERAKQMATIKNKVIMLHFGASWCQPCRKLEKFVFKKDSVQLALTAHVIPVKIDVDHRPDLAKKYRVSSIPAEVVIDGQGNQLAHRSSPNTASEYVNMLMGFSKLQPQVLANNIPSANSTAANLSDQSTMHGGQFNANSFASQSPMASHQSTASGGSFGNQASSTQNAIAQASSQASVEVPARKPTKEFSFAIDGFCPVTLINDEKWAKGDQRWGCNHRGKTYLFTSEENRDTFLMAPDAFSPLLAGYDPVVYEQQGQLVDGLRQHGAFFGGDDGPKFVVLFTNKQTRTQFETDPSKYMQTVRTAMNETDRTTKFR